MVKAGWLLALLAGCGSATTGGAASVADADVLTTQATVLESREHGPEICFGVAESLPPQCGGVPVTNWDWAEVPGEQSRSGTTWGDGYVVVGTFDGETFTLTEPVRQPDQNNAPVTEDPFATPCPEPEGGWTVLDQAKTTDRSLSQVMRVARRLADYGHSWVDQSINPAASQTPDAGGEWEAAMNDTARLIVNVAVTGDRDVATAALREVWGGPLCVSSTGFTADELNRIRREIGQLDGMTSVTSDGGQVELSVIYDDGSLQREYDEKYGKGAVDVFSHLTRVTTP